MEMRASAEHLEKIFPLAGIVDDMVISRRGDVTVGWEVSLPAVHSLAGQDYDDMLASFSSALRILPPWTLVHRQDIYLGREYMDDTGNGFLGKSYARHFSGRAYLTHTQRLFVTFASGRSALRPNSSCGIFGLSFRSGLPSGHMLKEFGAKAEEAASAIASCGNISLRRLTRRDYVGDGQRSGIVQSYMMLGGEAPLFSDVTLSGDSVKVYDRTMMAFSVSESRDLPSEVASYTEQDGMATSYASRLGIFLECDHIINQYLLMVPQDTVLQELDRRRRRMESMGNISENRVNAEEISMHMDGIHRNGTRDVYTHLNILAWGRHAGDENNVRSMISSALSSAGISASQNRYDTPVMWYAGIPGAGCEIGMDNMMLAELDCALSLGQYETFDDGIPGGRFKVCDRTRNIPVTLDIQARAREMGYTDNYNAFILGGSGTGKSFFTNSLLRNLYDAGEHIFIIDVGDSYEGLCMLINEESGGADGIYNSWDESNPFSFNPFTGCREWTDASGNLRQDCNGVNFFMSFLQAIWKPIGGWDSALVQIVRQTVADFVLRVQNDSNAPVFDDYYMYMSTEVRKEMSEGRYVCGGINVSPGRLDMEAFCLAMQAYSSAGAFGFLLNDRCPKDYFTSRFTVFEVDKLAGVEDRTFYSVCILCIMNAFDQKMRRSGEFKVMVIEEAWKAIANETMAPYLSGLWKTARKFRTSSVVVTQQMSDILSSPVIRDTILQNSSVKILLDQSGNRGNFGQVAGLLGIDAKETGLIMSMNRSISPGHRYKEVYISLGGRRTGVYATEVSEEEALIYESDKIKKRPLLDLARQKSSIIRAVREMAGGQS